MSDSRRLLSRLLRGAVSRATRSSTTPPTPTPSAGPTTPAGPPRGDAVSYAPRADGHADAGEIVWAWVPYEDDPTQGKDRPVLVLGQRDGQWLGLMLTSKDHDRDAADEARWGRHWMDVGAGAWDRRRRPSEIRLDRLLLLPPDGVRREGAALDRRTFDRVVAAARRFHDLG